MAGGGRRVVVVVVSWCFEPVVSLVRNPRNWGVSLRARTTDSDSLLVPLRRSLSLKGVDAMRRIRDRVAGLDVHRDSVVACVELFDGTSVQVDKATFSTTAKGVRDLGEWLAESEVALVVMEATGRSEEHTSELQVTN